MGISNHVVSVLSNLVFRSPAKTGTRSDELTTETGKTLQFLYN